MTSQPVSAETYYDGYETGAFEIVLVEVAGSIATKQEAKVYPLAQSQGDSLNDSYDGSEEVDEVLSDSEVDDWLQEIPSIDPVRQYLQEIGRTPLLNAEQEVELAMRIQRGKEATTKLQLLESEGQCLLPEEKSQLSEQAADGLIARNHLVKANLRLVVSLAKRYQGKGVDLLDLIQDANLDGLFHAVDKFDYKKGYKFSTYATWWIRQSLQRSLANNSRTIRVPVHQWEVINKVNKIKKEFLADNAREPTVEEIALRAKMSPDKVTETLGWDREYRSLDLKVGDDQSAEANEFIKDEVISPPDITTFKVVAMEALGAAFRDNTLTDLEKTILIKRFGLGKSGKTVTLSQLAEQLGSPPSTVAFHVAKALEKMRLSKHGEKMRAYL